VPNPGKDQKIKLKQSLMWVILAQRHRRKVDAREREREIWGEREREGSSHTQVKLKTQIFYRHLCFSFTFHTCQKQGNKIVNPSTVLLIRQTPSAC